MADLTDADLTRLHADVEANIDGAWAAATALALLDHIAALTARAETAEATVQRLEALAAEYESDAANEGYGGELWSWTASRVHAALAVPAQTEEGKS